MEEAATGAAAGSLISPGVGTVIGAGLGLVGGLFSGSKNYKLGKKQLEWQKNAQYITWQREDNAVQRRAADLQAAGMNRLLAAGSGATTTAPVHVDAPQYPDLSGVGNPLIQKAQIDMALMKQHADISQTEAQTKLLTGQLNSVTKQNELLQRTIDWYKEHPGTAPNIPGIGTTNLLQQGFDLAANAGERIARWAGFTGDSNRRPASRLTFSNAVKFYQSQGMSDAESVKAANRALQRK